MPKIAILSTLLLTACFGGKGIKIYNQATPAARQADDYVATDSPKAVRGAKRIAIPYFQVEFVQQSAASAFSMGSGTSKLVVTLTGVEKRQFASMADDFYDAVAADLTKAGLEVVPLETLRANPEFQKLASHGLKPSPDRVEHFDNISDFYAPHGLQIYYLGADRRITGEATQKKSKGSVIGGFSALGSMLGSVYSSGQYSYQDEERALAKALDARVLRVRVVVDFADVSALGGYSATTGAVRLSFSAQDSFYVFVGPDGDSSFSLKEALISGDGFAEKKKDGEHWEAAADGAAYEASVRKHLEAFRQMVMTKVAQSL